VRLNGKEIEAIRRTFREVYGEGNVYLFGSRLDDDARGGDIDLYLAPKRLSDEKHRLLSRFLLRLYERIGEQKIDCILAQDPSRPIEREAREKGVPL